MGTLVGTAVTVTAASCASTVPSNASKTSADGSVGEGAGGTRRTFSGGAPEGGNAAACVAGSCTASNGATSLSAGGDLAAYAAFPSAASAASAASLTIGGRGSFQASRRHERAPMLGDMRGNQ